MSSGASVFFQFPKNTLKGEMMDMAYRIDYCDVCNNKVRGRILPRIFMTAMFFCAFMIWVSLFWPEGREVLHLLLIPGDPQTTAEAAEVFICELDNGESLKDSVLSFWNKMTGYGIIR